VTVRRRVEIRHLLILAPFFLLTVAATRQLIDNSFLWHVRAGTVQLDAGRVLTSDPFSFTFLGDAWRTQSWLVELGYGTLERATGGLGFVPTMVALIGFVAIVFVATAIYLETSNVYVMAGWTVILGLLAMPALQPRPVLASFALLALLTLVVRIRRLWWLAVPVLWIWAAVHGSWPLGIGLLVLEAIRLRSRRLAGIAGLSFALTLFTAHGLGAWQVVIDFALNRKALSFIEEWQPPELASLYSPYVLVIVAIVIAAALGKLRPRDLIVVLPFLAFGLTSRRAVFPAAIVLIPYAARVWLPRIKSSAASSVVVSAIGVLLLGFVLAPLFIRNVAIEPEKVPGDDLVAQLDGLNLFHSDVVGGYLIYREWPDRLVFIDDRAELYGADFLGDYVAAVGGAYEELFAEHEIDGMLGKPDWPLTKVLTARGWKEQYVDEFFVLLVSG
jgi:hypothetical protein